MFNAQVGGQIAWLLPLAAVSLAGLWMTRRAPRTDLRRAGFVLFGVWALVHVGVFSSQQGSVAQLADLVRSGELRYVLLGGGGGGPGDGNQAIQAWVQQHGTVVTGSLYRVSA